MEAQIVVVGLNHKAAEVEVRERLAFAPATLGSALAKLLRRVGEGVILSTCNRTEIYVVAQCGRPGAGLVTEFLCEFHGLAPEAFVPYLYSLEGMEAVRHLFSVASGLDSMILGEPQILGQVRRAYEAAAATNAAGPVLSRAFHCALKVGKQARTQTGISRSAVSISHAAVELAREIFGHLAGCTVLLVGAGKMGELTAQNLLDNGITDVMVANRTHARAAELARRFGGRAVELSQLAEVVGRADVVITSAAAPGFILTEPLVRLAMEGRSGRSLFLIDIAVPRNVDPEVQRIPRCFVYDIDDLQAVCTRNLAGRHKEVVKAQGIVEAEVEAYDAWWRGLRVVPVISALRQRAEEIRRSELNKALVHLGELSETQISTLEALTSGIVNKILHQPTVRLKARGANQGGATYVQTLCDLFALDEEELKLN